MEFPTLRNLTSKDFRKPAKAQNIVRIFLRITCA